MDNPVVTRIVDVAAAAGLATIRFNFRGVGASTGTHGGGAAERRDLESALDFLRSAVPDDRPVLAAGYSFGSVVAAHVAAGGGVDALAIIAPPIGIGDYRGLPAPPAGLPVLVAVGAQDEYCPPAALERLRGEQPAAVVRVIEGANHFFFGKLYPLGDAVGAWLAPTVQALQAGQARRRGGAG